MTRPEIRQITEDEKQIQERYIASVKEILPHSLKYNIVTLGCQMNVHDSEVMAGMLDEMGMTMCENREDADLIIYNTCCVRENAENKALGNVIWLKELKAVKPDLIIGVGGCMTQQPGVIERIKVMYPFIDLAFGTHNMYKLPEMIYRLIAKRQRVFEYDTSDGTICEGLPVRRNSSFSAYINIMYGCNNFCTYCIVPYVRGRERSREQQAILDEAKALRDQGVKEIMLLGQNVNSYQGGGARFAELLYQINRLGIPRIRFMTSHPKDISPELIACFSELEHLCKHLHLPVQAGNNDILRAMNRRYTREAYIEKVKDIRRVCPDIGLTSDIVGFPGETPEQFEDTMSLVEQVRFDAAFTFVYSPREGTIAAKLPDHTTAEEKSQRIQRLIALQQSITSDVCESMIGTVQEVLVEGVSARDDHMICGKTGRSHMVNFEGDRDLIGRFARVRIVSAGKSTLRGQLID